MGRSAPGTDRAGARLDRRRELLDEPGLELGTALAALDDLERVNRWLLGIGATLRALLPRLETSASSQRLLDLGTGTGQAPAALVRAAKRRGVALQIIGVDRKLAHLMAGRRRRPAQRRVVAAADRLPFAAGSVDWGLATLLLHHFDDGDKRRVLEELGRVSRRGVVVVDLRRSRVALLALRLFFPLLRIGPVATHDGLLSLSQASTLDEVTELASGLPVRELRRRFPFRWSLVLETSAGLAEEGGIPLAAEDS